MGRWCYRLVAGPLPRPQAGRAHNHGERRFAGTGLAGSSSGEQRTGTSLLEGLTVLARREQPRALQGESSSPAPICTAHRGRPSVSSTPARQAARFPGCHHARRPKDGAVCQPVRMSSAARSGMAYTVAFVLADATDGMTDASATRRSSMP